MVSDDLFIAFEFNMQVFAALALFWPAGGANVWRFERLELVNHFEAIDSVDSKIRKALMTGTGRSKHKFSRVSCSVLKRHWK